jgi:hypothetical protein
VTTEVVVPLTCYLEDPIVDNRGLLDVGRRKCTKGPECCLHIAYTKRLDDIKKLRDVCAAGTREEDKRRERVLRAIARKPNKPIDEKMCRNLGDAVFAFFCPSDAVVLTTNIKDLDPLTAAVGKSAVRP